MIDKKLINEYSRKQDELLCVIKCLDQIKKNSHVSLNGKFFTRTEYSVSQNEEYIRFDLTSKSAEKVFEMLFQEIQNELNELEQKIKLELNGQPKNIS